MRLLLNTKNNIHNLICISILLLNTSLVEKKVLLIKKNYKYTKR